MSEDTVDRLCRFVTGFNGIETLKRQDLINVQVGMLRGKLTLLKMVCDISEEDITMMERMLDDLMGK